MHSSDDKGHDVSGRTLNNILCRKNDIMGSVDKSNSTIIPLLNVLIRGAWLITVQPFELEI